MSVPVDQMQAAAPADPMAAPMPAPYTVSEDKVKRLFEEIDNARDFDKAARKDYAFCRYYARGDSHWEVATNLIGTYIDIMVAFLYARDPDVAAVVAASVGNQRKAEAKEFAQTMETVLSRAWRDIKLKRAAERWVRSVLTTGIGWLKSGWQEVYETDPAIIQRKRDIQENLAKIRQKREEINDGAADDIEQREEELQGLLHGLEQQVEQLVYRGLFVDFVPAEHVQVSLNVQTVADIDSAKWVAHIHYPTLDEAKAKHPDLTDEDWASVETFHINPPVAGSDQDRTPAMRNDIGAEEADRYTGGTRTNGKAEADRYNRFVQHIELWHAEENLVYDLYRGVKKCASVGPPNVATSRFYPFFPLSLHEVDGERHPQSLVMRSYKLIDEYHRTRDGKADLRRRIKPKMAFDARAHTPAQIRKITGGEYAEWIPVKPAVEGQSVRDSIWEIPYPQINPALFDLAEVRMELETMWGIQEALSGGIVVAKTATEAEIQQAGTNARTGAMRDRIEYRLSEMANYHAEIVIQKMSMEDAIEMAGEGSIWPQVGVDDLDLLITIEIAAGTTGKPNTSAQREAWAAEMPVIQSTMERIGGLLMSPPDEMARVHKELLQETFNRSGDDRVDIDRFVPMPGQPMMLVDPATGQPVPAFPAQIEGGGGMPMPGGTVDGMPPPDDGGMPQGEAVAPVDLPPIIR